MREPMLNNVVQRNAAWKWVLIVDTVAPVAPISLRTLPVDNSSRLETKAIESPGPGGVAKAVETVAAPTYLTVTVVVVTYRSVPSEARPVIVPPGAVIAVQVTKSVVRYRIVPSVPNT